LFENGDLLEDLAKMVYYELVFERFTKTVDDFCFLVKLLDEIGLVVHFEVIPDPNPEVLVDVHVGHVTVDDIQFLVVLDFAFFQLIDNC
jgi:hypothetical protein